MPAIVGLLVLVFGIALICLFGYAFGWMTMSALGPNFLVSGLNVHLAAMVNGTAFILVYFLIGFVVFYLKREKNS